MHSIPTPTDPAPDLTAIAWHQLAHTLRKTLPPPLTDTPEDLLRRDQAAIARIAALCPVTVAEADIAALHVATSEQWKHCLALAQAPDITPEWAGKCRAQANAMMRQTQSSLRLFLRMQATREKRDADTRTCEQAACAEHRTLSVMTAALTPAPAAAQQPVAATPEPAPPPPPEPPEPEPSEPEIDPPLSAAEHYVVLYPERAALIRRCRGVPADVSFGPPDPELVADLLAATGPFFEALDVVYAGTTANAVSPADPSSHTPRNETPARLAAA